MRILMLFTIGFTIASAIGAYIGTYWIVGIVAFILSVILLLLNYKPARIAGLILTGLAVGMIWVIGYHAFYLDAPKAYDGKNIDATAVISDYSYETDYGIAADGKISIDNKSFSIRLYFNEKLPLKPGDKVQGKIRLRMTTNGAMQGQTYHQGDGIFLLGYVQENAEFSFAEKVPFRFFPAQLRHAIQTLLKDAFPDDTRAFATALFLGDSSLLDYATDTDFKLSGIRHIIAVSGLHVSILMSLVFIIFGKNRYLSAIIGFPLLFLFAAIVGFTPSVLRACIMQMLMLGGMFLNKEYDPPTSLSFAVLIMLLINPITIVSVSFQLSVGCIIGIFLLYERINEYLLRLIRAPKGKGFLPGIARWICTTASITISTFVATTPLSAVYFGSISIVGILTNLLTLWVVSFIFCGILIAVLFGTFSVPLAKVIAWCISIAMRYVLLIAKIFGSTPISAVYTKSVFIVIWLISCYCLISVLLLCKKKYPLLTTSFAVCLLVLAIIASWLEPKLDRYRVTVFDVGQGQSILIQYKNRSYLVDCGGDSERVAADTVSQHLLSQGITHLDGFIATHYDKDHIGGFSNLATSIRVDTLYLPDILDETGVKEGLARSEHNVVWIGETQCVKFPGLQFTMIPGEHISRDNERSMCILFQVENYDILITGDRSAVGERALLQKIALPKVELLVVGHHGSGTATSLELLERIRPDTAVISVGKDNFYGHPADTVLYRLRLFGCSVWRTDLDGTIVFRG